MIQLGKKTVFWIIFGVVLSLYLLTLSPGVVGGDAGEHQFAAPLLGIPHATGYPLYVLIGKLWTLIIPFGSMAWRMNLLSAVGGALAAAMTTVIVYYLCTPQKTAWMSALIAGLVLAWGLTLWQWSIIAGVRSLNVLFFALLTWEAILWQQQREQQKFRAAEKTLSWLAFTVGLSLAHHRTTIFYLPSLIGWIAWHDFPRQPKRLFRLILLTLLPLLLYLFIYFRGLNDPPYSHEYITDLQSFWFLVGASDSSGLFLYVDPNFLPARLADIWTDILAQLSWPGLILSAGGGIMLLRNRPKQFLFQFGLVLLLLLFTIDFEVVNLDEAPTWYLMPAYFIFAVWLGYGTNKLLSFYQKDNRKPKNKQEERKNPLFSGITAIFLVGLLAYTLAWPNWQRIYQDSVGPLDEWRQLLRGTQAQRLVESSFPYVEPNSLILGDWEQYTPFLYYQLIKGQRLDTFPRLPLDNWPQRVAAAHAIHQPVYLMRKTSDLIGTPYLSMVGPLIHLDTEPNFDIPPDITLLEANFESELELIGYQARFVPQPTPGGSLAGPILQMNFYWRVFQPLKWDYAFSMRLVDAQGEIVHQQDTKHPILGCYPTTLWTPGEVVSDFYEFPFPPDRGPLTLHLLPYRTEEPGQWHNLSVIGSDSSEAGILLGPFYPSDVLSGGSHNISSAP